MVNNPVQGAVCPLTIPSKTAMERIAAVMAVILSIRCFMYYPRFSANAIQMFSADSQNLTAHLIGEKLMKRGVICGGGRLQNVQYFSGFPADDQAHDILLSSVCFFFFGPGFICIVKRHDVIRADSQRF
nr:MAG TPA: hypothetical protein [Caudoviricetes sp.]